jgi:hypothetical protein
MVEADAIQDWQTPRQEGIRASGSTVLGRRRQRTWPSGTDCRIAGAVTLRSLVVLTVSTKSRGFELGDDRGVATTDYD